MTKKLLAIAALCLSAPAAHADRAWETCIDNSDQSDPAAIDCNNDWIQREEKLLASTWKQVLELVGGSKSRQGASLLAEQRAWIAFKDKSCKHYYTLGLGSLEHRNGGICRARVIADRTTQLQNIIADFPGED